MAVFRVEKNHNYTVMSNYHLRDTRLTLKSIGLLSKMLSLTDEWDYTTRGLAAICKEGVDAIGAALKELEARGYLVRRQLRDSCGRITDTEYTIYESPHTPLPDTASPDTENPYLDTPDTDEPYTEKPAQLNKDRRNKEKEIPDESITDTSNPDPIYPPPPLQGAGYDGMGYEEAREIVRENIEYDTLVQDPRQDREQLDEVVDLIAETLCSRKKTIVIAGDEYTEDELRAVLAGEKEHTPRKKRTQATRKKNTLLIDIEAKLQAGKGGGYERWAKVFNVKQMAQTYNYLREHGLLDYAELEEKASAATEQFHALSAQIKAAETRMAEIAVLKTHIINYAKTRDVYAGYRKAGYSKKYLAEHESDILLHKAAKNAFDELGVKKLPTVKSLQEEYAKLLAEKKAAYAEYRTARDEIRELLLHKQNVDRMLGKDERSEEKKQEHDRQ